MSTPRTTPSAEKQTVFDKIGYSRKCPKCGKNLEGNEFVNGECNVGGCIPKKVECRRCGDPVLNTSGLCPDCCKWKKKSVTFTVEFTVDRTWIDDGFDMTDDRALDMLSNDLKYAQIGAELDAHVISRSK